MKYWFDTEFIDNGKTIELISIGIISEDDRTYYAVSGEFKRNQACPWVRQNVLPLLDVEPKPRVQIACEIMKYIGEDHPEFWAWYGAYDWVVLSQLYGRMIDTPKSWPNFYYDLKAFATILHNPGMPEQVTTKHHALYDAIWTKEAYYYLRERAGQI